MQREFTHIANATLFIRRSDCDKRMLQYFFFMFMLKKYFILNILCYVLKTHSQVNNLDYMEKE